MKLPGSSISLDKSVHFRPVSRPLNLAVRFPSRCLCCDPSLLAGTPGVLRPLGGHVSREPPTSRGAPVDDPVRQITREEFDRAAAIEIERWREALDLMARWPDEES